jgi:chromosome segregation ATPase
MEKYSLSDIRPSTHPISSGEGFEIVKMDKMGSLPPAAGVAPYRQEDDRKRETARLATLQGQVDEVRQALRELASRQVRLEEVVKAYEGGVAENRLHIDQVRQENQVSARARAIDENRTRQQIAEMDQRLDDAVRPIRSLQAHVSELLEASRRKIDDTGQYQRRFEDIRVAIDHLQAVGDRNTISVHQIRESIEGEKGEIDLVRRDILRNEDAIKIVDQEMRRRIAEVAQAGENVNNRMDDLRADIAHAHDLITELQRSTANIEPTFEELRKADADQKVESNRINQQALERHEVIVDRLDDLRQAADAQVAEVRQSQDQRVERLNERIDELNEQQRELGVRISAFIHQLDELRLVDESLRRDLWQLHEQRVRLRLEQAQQELDQVTGSRRDSETVERKSVVVAPRPADR